MKIEKMHWLGIIVGGLVGGGSLIIFRGTRLAYFLLVIGLLVTSFPFAISFFWVRVGRKRRKRNF